MHISETMEFTYVREPAALDALVQRLATAHRVGLDTEADSLHNYFEKICLLQLTCDGEHYLIDPLAGLELGEFLRALAEMPLILHGGDYDLRMLRIATGFRPRREVFDTMIAAQLLGFEAIGLAALIERFFEIRIGKGKQKSDWSRRPLSQTQLDYAVNDTRYLEALAERLAAELRARGRLAWHVESCQAMVESTGRDRLRDPEEAWRIKGSGRLSRCQLAYLREIWRWRDEHARRTNRPAFHIAGNGLILELSEWAGSHPATPLEEGPKLPRNIQGELLTSLQQAITRVAGMMEAQWPERKRGERAESLSSAELEKLTRLRSACDAIAKELEIAASILAPKAALEAIIRRRPRSVEEIMHCSGLLRWQADLLLSSVLQCLD